jgi:hypothetical protein
VRQVRKSGLCSGLAIAAAMFVAQPVLANGGDFFEELALHGLQENPNMGSPYFGFARDARGRGVNGATVTITATATGETKSTTTNILGHYKLYGFDKSIDSEDVELTCSKDGFTQSALTRETMEDRPMQPVEANCTLAPVTASAQ